MEEITMPVPERKNFRRVGDEHPNAKLTWERVSQIRQEAEEPGTSRAWLARKYGMSRSAIDNIVRNRTWKDWS